MYNPGDRVEILRTDIFSLSHRIGKGQQVYGFVDSIDGPDIITVRPAWCTWTIELYSNEIRKLQ